MVLLADFWPAGHKVFKSTPETFVVDFVDEDIIYNTTEPDIYHGRKLGKLRCGEDIPLTAPTQRRDRSNSTIHEPSLLFPTNHQYS